MTHSAHYTAYLRSEQWAQIRRAMLVRCNHECQDCGRKTDLEVHHLTYDRLGHERPEDLTVLCPPCHERADKKRALATAGSAWWRRVDGWATKRYGEDWDSYRDPGDVEEEFSEWLERRGEGGY